MSDINWNKYGLKEGDRVVLDKDFRNRSEVVIQSFTPNKMYATVKADDGDQWQVMTNRLSPIIKLKPIKE